MRSAIIVALALLSSCGDDGTSDPAHWQLLGEHRPSSLLATWASSVDDVWVVGGREGAGGEPSVFHYDGTAWTKLATGYPNVDLWQVFGFAGGPVYFGGSNGTILRYQNGAFEKLTTPATDITFGLWGSSPDDVWAVGGQTTGRAFVWRYRGTAFEAVPDVPPQLVTSGTVWKVTGRAADDVWMSAAQGFVLHWDGATLSSQQIGAESESLFSIGCHASGCVTVGTNTTNGVLYQDEGQGWTSRVPTADGPVWRGMTPTGEHPYVVGMFGAVIRLTTSGWTTETHGLTTESLHAAWADADENVFAVGGQFDRALTTEGVLIYKGSTELPALP